MNWTPPKHIIAVCGLITDESDNILLVKTERRGWEIPGGQVENGETLTQALIREVQEESGVNVEVNKLSIINSNLSKGIVVLGFRASYISGELQAQPGETLDVRWVNPDEVLHMITHPVNLQRVKDMLDFKEQTVYRAYTLEPYALLETKILS